MSDMHQECGAAARGTVIALHGSASSGAQWHKLAARLGQEARLVAPDLWGYGTAPAWSAERPLTLADEAARVLAALPPRDRGPFDLVGHSYGGAVALHIARNFPQRVRSLVLIEPVAFHLLATAPAALRNDAVIAEVGELAGALAAAVERGEHAAGMARFVDYWNGAGCWERLPPSTREALATLAPKVPHDFAAAIGEPGDFCALRAVRCPVLVLRGMLSPRPVKMIAAILAGWLPRAELATLGDAGHMLPITHAGKCNELILWHFANAASALPGRAA